jgi:ribosomal protein L37AE/L43A
MILVDYDEEDSLRSEWSIGDYDNGDSGCPNCGRHRLCKCGNDMHRCEKCNWCPELKSYAPYSD